MSDASVDPAATSASEVPAPSPAPPALVGDGDGAAADQPARPPVQQPPPTYTRVSPYLLYEDAGAAMTWLCSAFGFKERVRLPGASPGTVGHGELQVGGDSVIMVGQPAASEGYQNPSHCGHNRCQYVHVYVEDVDAQFARATAAGAKVHMPPLDREPNRMCGVEDLEGHVWYFSMSLK
jgi:PhnB protein